MNIFKDAMDKGKQKAISNAEELDANRLAVEQEEQQQALNKALKQKEYRLLLAPFFEELRPMVVNLLGILPRYVYRVPFYDKIKLGSQDDLKTLVLTKKPKLSCSVSENYDDGEPNGGVSTNYYPGIVVLHWSIDHPTFASTGGVDFMLYADEDDTVILRIITKNNWTLFTISPSENEDWLETTKFHLKDIVEEYYANLKPI